MVRVNTDSATLDSSSSRLSLPAGARVLFAALYYGSRTTAGTGGKAAPDASLAGLGKVDFRSPGASGFDHLTAAVDQSTDVTGAYAAFVDVTGLVRRAGPGVYTVANVQSATGEDRYAGLGAGGGVRGRRRAAPKPDGVRRPAVGHAGQAGR